ncbi:hypothetical protein PF001_g18473 [Phytophthora fragariae]|uniref:Uncharacterized protein n=1 Tax=Phytophthora fragariae TaxID=53985 RepID=A0A6A4CVD0_9STRA|nr:hypothetical protein PF001_g18473 [Phytophthora fragariae]
MSHATVELNAVTRTTASLLRRRRGQAQSASGSCAVTTAHLFQAPNVIRSPVAVLARFYLAPAHLYQPRKSFKAPQRSYFTNFLLLLNFFSGVNQTLVLDFENQRRQPKVFPSCVEGLSNAQKWFMG